MRKLDIIIPVKNEALNVSKLALRVSVACKKAKIDYRMIFVDDHSTDSTVSTLKRLAKKYPITILIKKGKPGKAFSVIEASKIAKSEYIVMIDGDLQYPPEAIPEMFELAKTHGMVIANRLKHHTHFARRVVSKAGRFIYGKVLAGLTCDTQSGLKLFRHEIIEKLDDRDVDAWSLDIPLIQMSLDLGYSIGSVDIEFANRTSGASKVTFLKTAKQIAWGALKNRLRNKKVHAIEGGVVYKRKRYITHTKLHHSYSALYTLTFAQKAFMVGVLAIFFTGLWQNPFLTILSLVAILTVIYFLDLVFSAYVLLKSLHFPPEIGFSEEEILSLKGTKLPLYTVLCPLYKESRVLPAFVESINSLDWPKNKLEVLILLEEDDTETQNAAKALNLPKHFKVVIIPPSQPKTKPKACNYGLTKAKGEYVVIYDAEDKPDPLQLKKAFLAFKKLGEKYICVQSKLNYYNPSHNLLTRLFTAEYSLWFDIVLPGLQSIDSSIPLGGTSNHFKTKDLVAMHAWDPFNVTEDCDLGIRIFKSGFKTAIIDSVTFEEANSNPKNWVRQRSRWIKGYFQTYLVHMRSPLQFFREHKFHALLFQLIIGMRMTFMLINPILWVATIAYFTAYSIVGPTIEALYPPLVFYMAAGSLVVGNFMYIYNYMIGCAKRGHYALIKYVFLIPVYWLMTSVAAVVALYQLIVKPHFWEKTHHGLHLKQKQEVKATKFSLSLNTNLISAAFLIVASMLANFLNFLTSAYLGRNLGTEEFGLIALMGSFLFLVQIPSDGIGQTLSHQTALMYGRYSTPVGKLWSLYRNKILKISVLFVLLWSVSIPLLIQFFHSDTIIPFLVFAPMWTFLIVGAVNTGYLRGGMKFQLLALLILLESASKLIFSVLFVTLGVSALVFAALPLSSFVILGASYLFARRVAAKSKSNIELTSSLEADLKFPKKFFLVSILTDISVLSFLSLDLIFAKHFLTPKEAGEYALLILVGRMVYMVGSLFSQFILPVVSREYGMGRTNKKVFYRLLTLVLFSTSAMFMVVGPFGDITIPLLFGEKALAIIPFVLPFGFSMILFSLATSIVIFHQAKKEYIFVSSGILTSVLQVVLLYLFHQNILQIVNVMIVCGAFFLLSSLALHILYDQVKVVLSNIADFIDIFLTNLNGKKPLPEGYLRILIYNWRDTKHIWAGGAEVYVQEIAQKWVLDGHKVTLFCGNDGQSKRNDEINGVKIIRRGGFYTVYLWAFLYYVLRFRRRFDVVVESENGVPFFTPLYSTKPKVLVVHHIHQEVFRSQLKFPLSAIARFVESKLMPFVYKNTQVVSVSNSTRADLLKTKIAKEENIEIVTPGIEPQVFKLFRKTKYPSFVYLGRLQAYKNIDVAIRAFSEVKKVYPNALLTIAGEGGEYKDLRVLAKELGLKKSVVFAGRVSESEKLRLLGRSWAAIQPSSFEGWGITVIEANASGTPVIASNVSGLKDSVVNGETGILVPEKSSEEFARAMILLIKNKKYLTKISKDAHLWSKNYSWEKSSREFLNIINNNLRNKSEVYASPDVAAQME